MDAVEFLRERNRMCKSFNRCSDGCLAQGGSCKFKTGTDLEWEADKQVEIVNEWAAAHPRKTRQSVFLEQWPNCMMDGDGTVGMCPRNVDKMYVCNLSRSGECTDCRREFWMQEVE